MSQSKNIMAKIAQEFKEREIPTGTNFALNLNVALLGISTKDESLKKWNVLAMILKYYIYISKINKHRLNWMAALTYTKQKLRVYQFILEQQDEKNKTWHAWR